MKIGIIGCGLVVENSHLPTLIAMGFEIIWVFDSNKEREKKIAQLIGIKNYVTKNDFIENTEPDILLIAVPYGLRKGIYKKLENNFLNSSIFLEKPIALTLKEHLEIESLRKNTKIGVNYNRRTYGILSKIDQIINNKIFGNIIEISFTYGGFGIKTGGKYYSNKNISGGGTFFEVGIHNVDFILHLLKPTKIEVNKVKIEYINHFDVDVDASMNLFYNHQNIPLNFIVSNLRIFDNICKIKFENAFIEYSLFNQDGIIIYANDNTKITSIDLDLLTPCKVFDTQYVIWKDFVDGINKNNQNYTNLITSRMTTDFIEKVYSAGEEKLV